MDYLAPLLILSIALQALAAVLALRLLPLTGRALAWWLIAAALLLMLLRRLTSLVQGTAWLPEAVIHPAVPETVALLISALLVIGVYKLRALFAERAVAKAALHLSETKFRRLADGARDAIVMLDPAGRVAFWNQAARRMFGYSDADALGRPLSELIVSDDYQANTLQGLGLDFVRSEQTSKVFEFPARRKNGDTFVAEHSISALPIGDEWYAIAVIRDVTERRVAERRIAEQVDELQRFHRAAVDRELRIKELRAETQRLRQRLRAWGISPDDHQGRSAED